MSSKEHLTSTGAKQPEAGPSPGKEAERILREHSYQALRCLKSSFRDGVLTISGRLPSYYLTQIVLAEMRGIAGVDRVENRIEVTD